MNKRFSGKVVLVLAALGAMTLLQGCGEDEDFVIGTAWAPIGSMPLTWFGTGFTAGSTSGTGQSVAAASGTQ